MGDQFTIEFNHKMNPLLNQSYFRTSCIKVRTKTTVRTLTENFSIDQQQVSSSKVTQTNPHCSVDHFYKMDTVAFSFHEVDEQAYFQCLNNILKSWFCFWWKGGNNFNRFYFCSAYFLADKIFNLMFQWFSFDQHLTVNRLS